MKTSRITDDMFARIPALLLEGTTKAEIAAMYGVTRHLAGAVLSARHLVAQGRVTAQALPT